MSIQHVVNHSVIIFVYFFLQVLHINVHYKCLMMMLMIDLDASDHKVSSGAAEISDEAVNKCQMDANINFDDNSGKYFCFIQILFTCPLLVQCTVQLV